MSEHYCHANMDGDCDWPGCPQARDGEPAATGRDCPYNPSVEEWARSQQPGFPGIEYVDGATGLRPVVIGSIEVWEFIAAQKHGDLSRDELHAEFEWVETDKIDTALAYYEAHPELVDPRVESELAGNDETEARIAP